MTWQSVVSYFTDVLAVTKCHQDVQIDQHGQDNYAAYTAKYAPKFSDSLQQELLNDDADANSIAASVLARYHPCEPEMALQLFGSMFHQWHITTYSGGRRSFRVPSLDTQPLPKEVLLYQTSKWRGDGMSLLEFLRKSNDQGAIAGWLKKVWQRAENSESLEAFANAYKSNGEKVVACALGSRLRDKFYGQWLLLNVPFRSVAELLNQDILQRVPATDKFLALCATCPHPVARAMWDDDLAIDADMRLTGDSHTFRAEAIAHYRTQSHLVQQYLNGTLPLPAIRQPHIRSKAIQLPIQRRYVECLADGRKRVEGRVCVGASATVRAGDVLRLQWIECRVTRVAKYPSFLQMLQTEGFRRCIPDAESVQEALDVYHSFANYEALAQQHGVVAFALQVQPETQQRDQPTWNPEQNRWLALMQADLDRAAAVHFATSERDSDEARALAWQHNRIRALEGPPGTGKTTLARQAVDAALKQGVRVLWTVFTAQLASRMRLELGDQVDVDTCHAALGLGQELAECGLNLACYGLVILDEFSQLDASHFTHAVALYNNVDHACAFGLLGDRCQLAGFGSDRVWMRLCGDKSCISRDCMSFSDARIQNFAKF